MRAEQRVVQEGSSPSDARIRGVISESGVNSLAGRRRLGFAGGQGVHREVGSEGHEEKYRAAIDGETLVATQPTFCLLVSELTGFVAKEATAGIPSAILHLAQTTPDTMHLSKLREHLSPKFQASS